MAKQVRCFLENASIATPNNLTTPIVYELSDEGQTYAKRKERRTVENDDKNLLWSFHVTDTTELTKKETADIVSVAESFNFFLESVMIENKAQIITNFTAYWNNANPKNPILEFYYNNLLNLDGVKYPDYLSFQIGTVSCSLWLSNSAFLMFYPLYDIDVVPPFSNFKEVVKNPPAMLTALAEFDPVQFNKDLNKKNNGFPPTFTEFVNVPYRPSKSAKLETCLFGCNIYGAQGNYEYLLKDAIYDYLKNEVGLTDEFIETHFPTIFEVNEFFMIGQWENYALPSKVGQGSISSQMTSAYNAPFNIAKFIPAYIDKEDPKKSDKHFKENTSNVPFAYNNLVSQIVNGKHTEVKYKEFRKLFSDLLTVPVGHPDFPRMSPDTQRFLIMCERLWAICDSKTQTEMFNKVTTTNDKEYTFTVSNRTGVSYISISFNKIRYYAIPRYEYERISKGG